MLAEERLFFILEREENETGCDVIHWFLLAQDSIQRWTVLNAVNLGIT
jgi:hypothetical protein